MEIDYRECYISDKSCFMIVAALHEEQLKMQSRVWIIRRGKAPAKIGSQVSFFVKFVFLQVVLWM